MRIFLAGFLGAIAIFLWTTVAHMVLPLGEAGIKELPHETAVVETMQAKIPQPGLYMFPGLGVSENATAEQRREAMRVVFQNYGKKPIGILMFYPTGTRQMAMGRWLSIEFVTELIESFIAVFLLSLTRLTTFGSRVGFVTLAGVLAAIATNVSYWNWYGFPTTYTASYMLTQIVGFFCIGVVAALIMKPRPQRLAA